MTNKICNVPHLGTNWFNEHAKANIISFADETKICQVTMDLSKERAMLVYEKISNGRYARDPTTNPYNNTSKTRVRLTIVEANVKFLSPQ